MVLPPFKRGSEPTHSYVVAGVLRQLPPVEGVADSREFEVVDHPVRLVEFEPVGEEKTTSPHLSEQSHCTYRSKELGRALLLANKY